MLDILNAIPWWVMLFVGFVLGIIVAETVQAKEKPDGLIHVIHGEDKDQYLFDLLEYHIPPEDVPKMKKVTFGVQIEETKS